MLVDRVKIIHDELNAGESLMLSEYFQFVGSYVDECTTTNDFEIHKLDVVLIVTEKMSDEQINKVMKVYPQAIRLNKIDLAKSSAKDIEKYLNDCLDKIRENIKVANVHQLEIEMDVLRTIAHVFVKYNLFKMKYLLYYFKEDEQLIQFVQDKYVDAVIEINDKYFQNKSKYLVYFKLNLGRLINQTCVVLNQRFLFNTERCLEMLDEALMLDSTFNKVMFLKGYFTEIDPIYRKICHHYYQKALQEEGDKPYTSSFYYKLGSLCEFSEQGDNQTEYYYQKALQLNPNAYQAVYKLLLHDIKNTKYITALESAKRICNILDVKNSANYLLPQEYIYFNAGKYMEWYINSRYLCNQTAAFRARKEQNDLLFKIQTKENEIYRQIFTTESEKYLEKTYKKLKLPK